MDNNVILSYLVISNLIIFVYFDYGILPQWILWQINLLTVMYKRLCLYVMDFV